MKTMKSLSLSILFALLVFSACTHLRQSDPGLSGEYVLQSIYGEAYRFDTPLVLAIKEGRISGRGPVNNWSAAVTKGEVGLIMSTKMAGPPDLMEAEHQLFEALQGATIRIADTHELWIEKNGSVVVVASPQNGAGALNGSNGSSQ